MHFVRDEHKSNLIVFLVRIFRKKDVWISTQYIRGAVHVMKSSFHFVVAEKNLVRRVSHYFLYIAFLGGNALRHSLVM